jgi:uncharacterized protein YeaO (DUF488 family)
MQFRTKRVYEELSADDGFRVLVDRLWPRGLKKEAAHIDLWLRDIAPSDALRKWFGHEPARWSEFKRRYFAELAKHPDTVRELKAQAKQSGQRKVTLLFAAKDPDHNNAAVLRELLIA